MRPVNEKIIVSVNMAQKDRMVINGTEFSTALKYDSNFREKSPTIATVVHGNEYVSEGDILLCHHNLFYQPSPYFLNENLFAIPASNVLFAIIDAEGNLTPIYGNLLCDRVAIESTIPLPPDQQSTYINRALVKNGGNTRYQKGQLIAHRPYAGYDIVYNFKGVETRVTKVHQDQICGILK